MTNTLLLEPSEPLTQERYYQLYSDHKNGNLSTEKWNDYCDQWLTKLLEENKDVFVRLKSR